VFCAFSPRVGRKMSIRRGIVLLIALVAILSGVANGKSQQPRSRKSGKQKEKRARKKDPPRARVSAAGTFLLQSSQDRWKCFAGDGLRRCGSDTMWYQTSTSLSSYSNMHLRSSPDSTSSSDLCLVRKSCIEGDNVEAARDLSLGSCSDPCSAMKWSIEKDVINDLPVVVFNDLTARTQLCLHANVSTNRAGLSPCTEKFSTFFQMSTFPDDHNPLWCRSHPSLHSLAHAPRGSKTANPEDEQHRAKTGRRCD